MYDFISFFEKHFISSDNDCLNFWSKVKCIELSNSWFFKKSTEKDNEPKINLSIIMKKIIFLAFMINAWKVEKNSFKNKLAILNYTF